MTTTAPVQPLRSDLKLHDGTPSYPVGQISWLRALKDPAISVVTIAVGRQVGKTTFVPEAALELGSISTTYYKCAYIAQGHKQAASLFRDCLFRWEAAGIVKRHMDVGQDRWIELKAFGLNKGFKMFFWSGDGEAHRSAAGETLHAFFLDEASLVPEDAYFVTFRPMLNVTRGKACVIGSPTQEGQGWVWFRELFDKGIPGENYRPGYKSFNAPSECNPFTDPKWIVEQRAMCRSKAQEMTQYDGLFVEDTGAVFGNLNRVFSIKEYREQGTCWTYKDREADHNYVVGIDFGKWIDHTVVSIFDRDSGDQVLVARLDGDYREQMPEVDRLIRSYGKPWVYVEGREGGVALTEILRARFGDMVREVKWTRGGKWDKESSVFRGVDLCQRESWRLIDLPIQREEFRLFMRRRVSDTSIGWHYEAPKGKHDDFVAAALYAAYGLPVADRKEVPKLEPIAKFTPEWWDMVRETQGKLPASSTRPARRIGM